MAAARPPRCPRVAIERMKTPGSVAWACMRIRSPRIAPPLKGEVGSTATMPTVRPCARRRAVRRSTRVDLPAPGRAGHAHDQGAPGVREQGGQEGEGLGPGVLDEADRAGHGPGVTGEHAFREAVRGRRGLRHYRTTGRRCRSSRAMTRRCTSLVPSPMVPSFASRR